LQDPRIADETLEVVRTRPRSPRRQRSQGTHPVEATAWFEAFHPHGLSFNSPILAITTAQDLVERLSCETPAPPPVLEVDVNLFVAATGPPPIAGRRRYGFAPRFAYASSRRPIRVPEERRAEEQAKAPSLPGKEDGCRTSDRWHAMSLDMAATATPDGQAVWSIYRAADLARLLLRRATARS
jgi:hypothetical protein